MSYPVIILGFDRRHASGQEAAGKEEGCGCQEVQQQCSHQPSCQGGKGTSSQEGQAEGQETLQPGRISILLVARLTNMQRCMNDVCADDLITGPLNAEFVKVVCACPIHAADVENFTAQGTSRHSTSS